MAKKANIGVLAITDHDTYDERIEEVKRNEKDILVITGAEFSTKYISSNGQYVTVHVIGLFFDYKNKKIQSMFHESRVNQESYIKAILKKLSDEGMVITYEELLKANPGRKVLGRIPIAKLMMQKGFPGCETVYKAMDNWIGSLGLRKCYVEGLEYLNFPAMSEVIKTIREAGGIAVLCHPYYYYHQLGNNGIENLIKYFKFYAGSAGALEVFYKDYTVEQQKNLKNLADKYELLPSAGSDYHGQDICETLNHHFPITIYDALLERKKNLYSTK